MSFLETVESARAFLKRNGRVSLRALQREFDLDDDALSELIGELVEIQQVAVRNGRALAWAGSMPAATSESAEHERSPRDYTPKHLADKILTSKSALEPFPSISRDTRTIAAGSTSARTGSHRPRGRGTT